MNLDANQVSIREVCDAGLLAGAVTVVWQRGEVLQINENGHRDVEAVPMTRDTLFRIASMTKPVTVAAADELWTRASWGSRPDRPVAAGIRRRARTGRSGRVRWTEPIRPPGRSRSRT